jgi:hypothetical protein
MNATEKRGAALCISVISQKDSPIFFTPCDFMQYMKKY